MRLNSLTGLRFFAALLVVLLHTTAGPSNPTGIVTIPGLKNVAALGYLGVTFFFTLSGFVLTWTAKPSDRPKDFYRRRFARIYPLHFATWAVFIAAAGSGFPVAGGVLALVLLQAWVPNAQIYFAADGVSWSLSCEAFFYAMTPLFLIMLSRGRRSAATTAVASVAWMIVLVILQSNAHVFGRSEDMWVFPLFGVGAFLLGMCSAHLLKSGYQPPFGLWTGMAVTVAAYAVLMIINQSSPISRPAASIVFAIASTILIIGAAGSDIAGRASFLGSKPLIRLGEWSFALYLLHPVLLKVLQREGFSAHGIAKSILVEVAFIVVTIAASAVAYTVWERPIEKRLRPPSDPMRTTMAAAESS
jgi:peptidoglycan/LPS O-acetylase OafA/YrhL